MAAEVGGDGGGKKKSKKGRKKKSNPRIDLTPMVDLGFLLLTFFVLTTTMSTPTAMPVVVPADKEDEPPKDDEKVSDQKIMFMVLTGKDRIYWYRGIKDISLNVTNFSAEGVRKVLFEQREAVKKSGLFNLEKDPDPMIALIKMSDDASYKNLVDILDEMNITDQKKYMLLDAEKGDVELIEAYEKDQSLPSSIEKSLEKMKGGGEAAPAGA